MRCERDINISVPNWNIKRKNRQRSFQDLLTSSGAPSLVNGFVFFLPLLSFPSPSPSSPTSPPLPVLNSPLLLAFACIYHTPTPFGGCEVGRKRSHLWLLSLLVFEGISGGTRGLISGFVFLEIQVLGEVLFFPFLVLREIYAKERVGVVLSSGWGLAWKDPPLSWL